ncbi:glycerophosphodiester phosphodiesterase [Paenibacillus terreus]|uniref:Glycerophosphodiester phosphodiesterase n=1 Tax=Paenibacillus terreus TaxID=1387834 RepID=A0ABV5B7K2_9BACL
MTNKVINFAHRGASGTCPENTMAAFRRALELGATGIETDVQRTRDGRLVLIHDEYLLRTTGDERLVEEVTVEEVRELDAGSWFGEAFKGEKLPFLEELLDLVSGTDIILNLELKNSIRPYSGMEEQVIAAVKKAGLEEQVLISSFNHYSLAECKKIAPEIQTGVLYIEGLYQPWEYARTFGATALHPYKEAVTPEWVAAAAEAGIVYNPFTVNEAEEMKSLIAAGVNGIITDYPELLHELLTASMS